MKILCSGDWHVRATTTKYRTSEYTDLMFNKIKWIIDFAIEQKCFVILQPGDFFDSPDIPNHINKRLIKLILGYHGNVYTVFGQHDTKYRNLDNTALAVFAEAEVIDILNDTPIEYEETLPVHIYGASWEKLIPKPTDNKACNILVLHKMIVKDKPLFPDQTDYLRANDFATKCKDYNIIISGDNHNSFSYTPNGHRLPSVINCGSLMRMTTAQYTHRPCVWLFDTITNKITQHYIPIKPVQEVFKPEAAEMKERDKKMDAFIKTITNTNDDLQLSFEDNLKTLLSNKKVRTDIQKLAKDFIKKYYEQGVIK
jgi:DNA repair exonuclease SbcCD nuclease subunit